MPPRAALKGILEDLGLQPARASGTIVAGGRPAAEYGFETLAALVWHPIRSFVEGAYWHKGAPVAPMALAIVGRIGC